MALGQRALQPSMKSEDDDSFDQPVEIPITGELDLHMFRPRDVKIVVIEYLEACREKGIHTVRIVHGKGTGQMRETVHALLRKHPDVQSFRLAGEGLGSWGATMVALRPLEA